jgi:hypothetical protein
MIRMAMQITVTNPISPMSAADNIASQHLSGGIISSRRH